jgi:hypothetical protein
VLEAKLGPMGAERRDRATAFRVIVATIERSRIGHGDITSSPKISGYPFLEASEPPCGGHASSGGVLDPIDDRDRVESGSRLPRRLAVTGP